MGFYSKISGSISIGEKLRRNNGVGEGFDLLRLVLATSVVAFHAPWLVADAHDLDGKFLVWLPGYGILSIFFALSGFLIAGSAGRLKLNDFLLNRGLRIFPALAIEVIFSAFILGIFFTNLSFKDYISNGQTWQYLTNIIALINYHLPGVFLSNPQPEVNISLWTVPYEFLCYAIMSLIIIFGLIKRPKMIVGLALLACLIGLVLQYGFGMMPIAPRLGIIEKVLGRIFVDHPSRLLVSFLLGIYAYQIRDHLPYSKTLLLLALGVCAIFAVGKPAEVIGYPIVNLLLVPALAYLMVYVGVSNVYTPKIFRKGDYSYGIYLYGMPVQQVMIASLPGVRNVLVQFCISMIFIVIFSAFSWHYIEKPILKLRKKFSFISAVRLQK